MRVDIAELRLKKEKLCEHVVNSPDRLKAEKGREGARCGTRPGSEGRFGREGRQDEQDT